MTNVTVQQKAVVFNMVAIRAFKILSKHFKMNVVANRYKMEFTHFVMMDW